MQKSDYKKQEIVFILILILLLAAVLIISNIAFGVNLGLFRTGFQSMGYDEVNADGLWAVTFHAFSGEVSRELSFPENSSHRLRVRCNSESGALHFALDTLDGTEVYASDAAPYDFSELSEPVSIRIEGDNIINGSFAAIWD